MFDFFGRVICQHCKSRMVLEHIQSRAGTNQAIFRCSNAKCYEEAARTWQPSRRIVYEQQSA